MPLGPVSIESDGVDAATVAALEALGHEVELVEPKTPLMGWAQVIRRRPDGSLRGRRRSSRRLRRGRALNRPKFTPHGRYARFEPREASKTAAGAHLV